MSDCIKYELPIGCKFIYGNVQLVVVESPDCDDCYFNRNYCDPCVIPLACTGYIRADGTNVAFKHVGNVIKVVKS